MASEPSCSTRNLRTAEQVADSAGEQLAYGENPLNFIVSSGQPWRDACGNWIWCCPVQDASWSRVGAWCDASASSQRPGGGGYAGCRCCGSGDHRAVHCPVRFQERVGKEVARMVRVKGIDVEYVNTPNTSQYVGPAQTRMIHVFNTCIAVTIRHNDCSSSIYGTSESFVTVIKEPSTIRN